MADRKFDLFAALNDIDRRDWSWYGKIKEDARKEVKLPVLLRWISTVGNGKTAASVLKATNEVVNWRMYDIVSEHPELVYKLTALCGTGQRQKHEFLPVPGRQRDNKARELLERFYPMCHDDEIDMLIRLHTRKTFEEFVSDTAVPDNEAKEIMKAYAKLVGKDKEEDAGKRKA